jgi:hypothetical protein
MLEDFRKGVVGYWEKRRLIFNLLLLPSAWFAWNLSSDFTFSIDGHIPARIGDPFVVRSALSLLLIANVCYSIVYFIEVCLMSEKKRAFWPKGGRLLVFCTVCAVGMLLTSSKVFHLQSAGRGPWQKSVSQKGAANQSSDPTSASVTPPAGQESSPR